MIINGDVFSSRGVFPSMMTVPDCIVTGSNKLGSGHGEAKFYIASKDDMHDFYGHQGFRVKCFMLKSDLLAYMNAIRNEYLHPTLEYAKKNDLPRLWSERVAEINKLDDIILFHISDQDQIAGPRGYINSEDRGYQLLRKIALPLVSYVFVEKLACKDEVLFYWKLFVDFAALKEKQNLPLVFVYGKAKNDDYWENKKKEYLINDKEQSAIRQARDGQGKYREQLLAQCHFCPISMISDERILIASHIKPWAASDDAEKIDPYNGYMLSPMYDKLFDRGFITFSVNRRIILSEFLSPNTWKQIGLKNGAFIQALPMDDKREQYLQFHHESVFKGSYHE